MKLPSINNQRDFLLIDVGAADGFQGKWDVLGARLRVIGFEPDLRTYDLLDKSDPRVTYINAALGKAGDKRTLFLTAKAQCSSTFPANTEFLENFPDPERYELVGQEQLRVATLDDALRAKFSEIPSADFVKLDVHGVEPDIIEGGLQTIANGVIGFEIETSFQELWKGQALFSDVNAVLVKLGFQLYDIKTVFWRRNNKRLGQLKGQIIYGDTLYFRSPEGVRDIVAKMADRELAKSKALNSIIAFLIFGYKDSAEAVLNYCADHFTGAERVEIERSMQISPLERFFADAFERVKLHSLANWLAELTNWHKRNFFTISGKLGNYDTH